MHDGDTTIWASPSGDGDASSHFVSASSVSHCLDTTTGAAPPFRAALTTNPLSPVATSPMIPQPGMVLNDFELLRVLGAGAFGQVYLARQVSLGRLVALKVTANQGNEARTLARLEHPHIVQVFAEVLDAERDLRLLCMQYIPGTTLQRVMDELRRRPRAEWNGQAFLEIIDALCSHAVALDLAALRDRELLGECDFLEAVCWMGTRLAEALAHAHGHGVLHRDVKPANVLLSRYGRPYLADFNVSSVVRRDGDADETFGGTLAYMAPEHLEAFISTNGAVKNAVDERADIYALGLVLFEMLAGGQPFVLTTIAGERKGRDRLRALVASRRVPPAQPPREAAVPQAVARLLQRCLEPEPAQRYQHAADLARALDGCRELRRAEKELPPPGVLTRLLECWPFLVGCLLVVLPHVLASLVNVSYNAVRIRLSEEQENVFVRFVMGYNAFAYPICLLLTAALILPVRNVWRRLRHSEPLDAEAVTAARRRMLRWPLWTILVSGMGWLPGGILFPLGLHILSGPIGLDVFGHFVLSFTLSGLIALTYSFLAMQFLVLRVLYPRFWIDAANLHETVRFELGTLDRRLGLFQFLAVLIPLAGAVLMIGVGPETFQEGEYRTFRLLVTILIALGMTGLGVALVAVSQLRRTSEVLTGRERRG
jgi:eukaryotic-like serine/threonine-protein kinase